MINNENGLHLEKVSISSGGAGPVILVDETYGSNSIWTFEKISGNIYNILYSGWLRDIPINTYALTAFMDEQQKTWVSIAPFDPNNVNQKWRVAN